MSLDWSCALAGADASRAVVTAGPSGHQAIARLETAVAGCCLLQILGKVLFVHVMPVNALGVMAQQRD